MNRTSEKEKNFKYCGMKISFLLSLILFASDLFGQVDFKNDGIVIEDTFGLISVKHSDSNNASTGNVIINGFSQIDYVMNLDVLNYYEKLKDKYNTELKIKYFKQTTEYLDLLDELTELRNELKNSFILFSSPASKDVLSDYSLSTKSFSLEVMAGLSKSFGINNENHFVCTNFALDLLKIKTTRINQGFYESYYFTSHELVEKDEINALKIEENKNNILVYFITNIVEEKNLTKTEGFKEHRKVYFPSFYRILIFNKLTYDIYIDRLYTSNGEVDMQPKDIEKLNKSKLDLSSNEINNKSENYSTIIKNYYDTPILFNLAGRIILSKFTPIDLDNNEEGKVVVEITVDRYGKVSKAVPGAKGTTNLNSALLNAAKNAALSTMFSQKLDSLALQTGTITYVFKNNKNEFVDNSEVFVIVEDMPEFEGGELALRAWIAKNIKYPELAKQKGLQGKVYVTFIVERNGNVTNSRIARGVDLLLDNEALRVINSLPKWIPGKQQGKAVRVSYTVPVNFQF